MFYAKTPLAGPEVVPDCLSRYTHRVAVSNERIVGIDANGMRLRVRADNDGGKRTIFIDGQDFIAGFLQHVLPSGCKRIRRDGLLSPAVKAKKLAAARAALALPAANEQARGDAAAFLKRVAGIDIACCPHCKPGRWRTTATMPPERPAGHGGIAKCRGPPGSARRKSAGYTIAIPNMATDLLTPAPMIADLWTTTSSEDVAATYATTAPAAVTANPGMSPPPCAAASALPDWPAEPYIPQQRDTPRPCRRFSPTRFIRRHQHRSAWPALTGRRINAFRQASQEAHVHRTRQNSQTRNPTFRRVPELSLT